MCREELPVSLFATLFWANVIVCWIWNSSTHDGPWDKWHIVKSLKEPSDYFDISRYVSFSSGRTRLSSYLKLSHASAATTNSSRNFYFNRLPRLWNSLPLLDINQWIPTIKTKLYLHLWSHFTANFDPDVICSYHYLCPCANCSSLSISYNFDSYLL